MKLFGSQSVIEFNVETYTFSGPNGFTCDGRFAFGGRFRGEDPQPGKLNFEWSNKEKEIGVWTMTMNGKEVPKMYFTNQERIKEYPTITIGPE